MNAAKTEKLTEPATPQYGGRSTIYQADCRSTPDAGMAWGLPVGIAGGVVLVTGLTLRAGRNPTETS